MSPFCCQEVPLQRFVRGAADWCVSNAINALAANKESRMPGEVRWGAGLRSRCVVGRGRSGNCLRRLFEQGRLTSLYGCGLESGVVAEALRDHVTARKARVLAASARQTEPDFDQVAGEPRVVPTPMVVAPDSRLRRTTPTFLLRSAATAAVQANGRGRAS